MPGGVAGVQPIKAAPYADLLRSTCAKGENSNRQSQISLLASALLWKMCYFWRAAVPTASFLKHK